MSNLEQGSIPSGNQCRVGHKNITCLQKRSVVVFNLTLVNRSLIGTKIVLPAVVGRNRQPSDTIL